MLGQVIDDQRGGAERDHRREQREDPQRRAAVDDEQDQDHHAAGREQQGAIDPGERVDERGEQAAGTRAVNHQPGRRIGARDLQHRLLVLGDHVAVERGVAGLADERHADLRGRAVGRELRRRNLIDIDPADARERGVVGGDLRLVVGGEAGRALVDDEARDRLDLGELLGLVVDLGRFSRRRQVRRVVVLLDLAQLARVLAADDATDDEPQRPDRGHDPHDLGSPMA